MSTCPQNGVFEVTQRLFRGKSGGGHGLPSPPGSNCPERDKYIPQRLKGIIEGAMNVLKKEQLRSFYFNLWCTNLVCNLGLPSQFLSTIINLIFFIEFSRQKIVKTLKLIGRLLLFLSPALKFALTLPTRQFPVLFQDIVKEGSLITTTFTHQQSHYKKRNFLVVQKELQVIKTFNRN